MTTKNKKISFVDKIINKCHNFVQKRKKLTKQGRRNQNLFLIFCFLSMVVVISLGMRIIYGRHTLHGLEANNQSMSTQKQKLNAKEENLKNDVKLLKDDNYVLKVARDRFLVSKDGELVFTVVDNADEDVDEGLANDPNNQAKLGKDMIEPVELNKSTTKKSTSNIR